jgi:hypothetical protein
MGDPMRPTILLLAFSAALATGGCGGMSPIGDAQSLMDQTTAGKDRCVSAGDEHKLFVVEWDATDASTFQARASRDVVFVHYEGCQLRVVDGCSDGSLAGRYGSYREPVFTSGATESFTISTADELAAKLPLGAVSLGAELSNDRALELTYFVSGTTLATRDEIYQSDLAQNPRCADVTHAVVAYNLGAFELQTTDDRGGSAGVDYAGAGVSGSHRDKRNNLRHAGDLAACKQVDNHPCRVPIRLTLRPIRPGAAPAGVAGPVQTSGDPGLGGVQASMKAMGHEQQAMAKLQVHDGQGCLADLDQADLADPQGKERRLELRARCEMRGGQCEAGKAHYREARKAWHRKYDQTGLASDATIDHEVEQMAKAECATAAGGGKSVQGSAIGLVQQIMQASGRGDADACIEHGKALSRMVKAGSNDATANQLGSAGLSQAAQCAAKGGRCKEAKPLYLESVRLLSPDIDAESAWKVNVKECQK